MWQHPLRSPEHHAAGCDQEREGKRKCRKGSQGLVCVVLAAERGLRIPKGSRGWAKGPSLWGGRREGRAGQEHWVLRILLSRKE